MKYYYFPILKTRKSEVVAYENLDDSIKNIILPIIELTGALSYTYPKNYKIESLRGTKRPGDISKKRQKILDLMEGRKFILDITDDDTLKHDGLSETSGGLLDHSDGYNAWITFLSQEEEFKKSVIPTIQFNTNYVEDVMLQIEKLNKAFEYLAIKLPAFIPETGVFNNKIIFNTKIQQILDLICQKITNKKLILILDFGYIEEIGVYENMIREGLTYLQDISKLKAMIPVCSSFPNYVVDVNKPIKMEENSLSKLVMNTLEKINANNSIYHGDFAGIHPTKYEMGGGGWIPRIDYIVRDANNMPIQYDYARGTSKNTSAEYYALARKVSSSTNYKKITALNTFGDMAIEKKAENGIEGKAPFYWIAVRSNLFMTMETLYLKEHGAFLTL